MRFPNLRIGGYVAGIYRKFGWEIVMIAMQYPP
jgi:hypothetical protein